MDPGTDDTTRLVALGLDRDAARRAVDGARRSDTTGGNEMDGVRQLDAVVPTLLDVASRVASDQLDAPTPCAGFRVRDVMSHMIGGAGFFAAQLHGEPAPTPPPPGTDLAGDDPVTAFRSAIVDVHAAAATDGAAERDVIAPFGTITGEEATRYLAFDGLVHTWDLAQATGQRFEPPEALVAEAFSTARTVIRPEMRDGDTFATPVPVGDDATLLEQLVAFTGRTP